MKKLLYTLLLALPFPLSAQNAKIKIDIDRTIGEIDPKIYGVFMEPIHFNGARMGLPDTVDFNTLYGNLYDPSSPLTDEHGFRKDYIDAMKELKITNMRWPGGNFVMGYNWKDGIGPKDQRPTRINLAWGGVDNNHVGTDEWITLNKSMGSENIVCVNLGLATIQDAAEWVEYCNYIKGTYYSDLRIKNGHKEPYSIKIWDLGNEVDGEPWELGYKNADDYVKIGREAAKAMKAVDGSIKLVASGSSYYESTGKWVDWNRKVLEGLGDKIDYISIHRYWERSDDYYSYMGQSAMDFEEKITIPAAAIETARAKMGFQNPIYISFDEWGVFGRDFRGVLPIAQCLNSFVRHADVVKMTNFTLMTSLIQTDPEKGSFKTPLFHTFKMFSNNCLGNSIDPYVECDTFNTEKYKGIPYLDVTAVYAKASNTVYINVVNRHKDKAIITNIQSTSGDFDGKAEISIINRQDLNEPFTYDNESEYVPGKEEINVKKNEFAHSFPPHSITQIKVGMKQN
jgi:alpha-N-arabinofuranosidase